MMRSLLLSSPLLPLLLYVACGSIPFGSSFSPVAVDSSSSRRQHWDKRTLFSVLRASSDAAASSSENDAAAERPSNLVDKDSFVAAVDALKVQITKETGQEFPSDETTTAEGDKLVYVLGRIADLRLSFAPTPPGLALTDATGLTIVAAVGESSMESGIQPFDTITSIGADGGSFRQETNGMSLSETTTTLTAAANYAVEKGLTEIEIEVNRLMKGYYK